MRTALLHCALWCALGIGVPSAQERWVVTGYTRTDTISFNPATLEKVAGSTFRVWMRRTHTAGPRTVAGQPYGFSMGQVEIDCDRRETNVLTLTRYQHDSRVVQVDDWRSWPPDWTPARKGTLLGTLVDGVCFESRRIASSQRS